MSYDLHDGSSADGPAGGPPPPTLLLTHHRVALGSVGFLGPSQVLKPQ
jgi:hypothetical protein